MNHEKRAEIANDAGLSHLQKLEAIFAAPAELVLDDEEEKRFFHDNANRTISNFWRLLDEFEEVACDKMGKESAEFKDLVREITPIKAKIKIYGENILHPSIQRAVRPLHEIWAEYRGYYQDDGGSLQQRSKEPDRAILSAFDRTASFDL